MRGGCALIVICAAVVGCGEQPIARRAESPPNADREPIRGLAPLADPVIEYQAESQVVRVSIDECNDITGRLHRPMRDPRVTAFVFLSAECPISNAALPELRRLANEQKAVRFYGVVSEPGLTAARAREQFAKAELPFPILFDVGGSLRMQTGATHAPQVVVVDAKSRLCYSGRIDDRFVDLGKKKTAPVRRDLSLALTAISGGREVENTKPVGCILEPFPVEKIVSASSDANTFAGRIGKLIHRRCANCHRPGEATPFPLLSYSDVRKRARQILHVVERRIMPPWKPEPDFGHFADARRLPDAEIQLLKDWITAGCPQGDAEQMPEPSQFAEGWKLGKPDLIIEMPDAFEVPADGPDIYRHFVLPAKLKQHRLVAAMEFRPGNPRVVHHSFVYFDTSGKARELDASDPGPGYTRFGGTGFRAAGGLGGWGPGGRPRQLPRGMGRPMPENGDVVVQIHYHPIGTKQADRSKIGIYFADSKASRLVTELMVADVDLEIPAGEKSHRHTASYTLPVATTILDITPHMHTLGKSVKAVAVLPGGRREPLVWIKDWDFYWQDSYTFSFPIRLPAGTRIEAEFVFDNSTGNPQNPNSPPQLVRWGENSTDEMGVLYLQATTDSLADYAALNRDVSEYYSQLEARAARNKKRLRK